MRNIRIAENDAGQRLDKFLVKALEMPVSLIYKYLRKKRIRLNGARAQGSTMLRAGDELALYINDEFFARRIPAPVGRTGALEVVYEDAAAAVLNKPPGLLCHADAGADSLVARFCAYLYAKGEYNPAREQSFTPALCNRLDRNTAGLVLAAKTAAALRAGNEKFRLGQIKKYYLCRVEGAPPADSGVVAAYLKKDGRTNKVTLSDTPGDGARAVRTGYRVVARQGAQTLIEVELFTGRPHQIRATMERLGCPIVGDIKYGGGRGDGRGQRLCAYRMAFDFAADGGPLDGLAGKEVTIEGAV